MHPQDTTAVVRRNAVSYEVDPVTGCWNWIGKLNHDGYPRINRRGRSHLAYRYFFERAHGPIPDGFEVDHICRNRACVNLDHLQLVSRTENIRRSHRTKLTTAEVNEIRGLLGILSYRQLAKRFGVTYGHIGKIARGEHWIDIEP